MDRLLRRQRLGQATDHLLRADLPEQIAHPVPVAQQAFGEGVDGEAVDWACKRMLARPERRRILLVVSDGCPMDTATNLANDEFYLAQHLKQVVARREAQGAVEICGLGLGLDLGAYYSRSLATTLPASLNNELFSEIAQLLAGRKK